MKIEISIGEDYPISVPSGFDENGNTWYIEDTDTEYEHEGYYETINDAIQALQRLKEREGL